MISLCNNWEYAPEWSVEFLRFKTEGVPVRLPHNAGAQTLHYTGPASYEGIRGYRRKLRIEEQLREKRIFLQFDGAAHIATLFVNGQELCTHRCGYTAFRVEITEAVRFGADNEIVLRLDTTENASVPPFGFVIDYLTYGGLYREAWLDVREQDYISDVFVYSPDLHTARVLLTCVGSGSKRIRITDRDGRTVGETETDDDTADIPCPDALPWCPDDPKLYLCEAELLRADGSPADAVRARFGFRMAQFRSDGFYLNGVKTFLRGLNRHQCYPYMGYAAPRSLQREDARLLRQELGCVAVRTSHYPQSQAFVDACDELGLFVFTEIPGWQHIGDGDWKNIACENTREMVLQYRNHPSVILWGVRINESQDDDGFYRRTNEIAHALDPSRATSGVRYLENSSLLEDVYAFNDFSHTGNNPGCKPKKSVTRHSERALLISEHNGHMFPTKMYDPWAIRQEQALRHARVQNDARADGDHVGCFGWCMFDYPTHKDFGSGDRVCYHGVMDAFRNPKPAAALYASQSNAAPVLEVGSSMDIGDYPAGNMGEIYVFTNAEEVRLYKNDVFVTSLRPKSTGGLEHPPIPVNDLIGELLETQEGFDAKKAARLRDCLQAVGTYGFPNLPLLYKLKFGFCMLRYALSMEDGVALYGKYVGNWGGEATRWRFDALCGGKVTASTVKSPGSELHLTVQVDHSMLQEGASYDAAAVRVRICDENGNQAYYAQLPVHFELNGAAELIGPDTVTAEGGACGTYVRTCGRSGIAALKITCGQTKPVTVGFSVRVDAAAAGL